MARYLSIPLNDQGLHDYDYDIKTSNVLVLPFGDTATNTKIINTLNATCNLHIDDFESEIITNDKLTRCLRVLEDMGCKEAILYKALLIAIEAKTIMAIDL